MAKRNAPLELLMTLILNNATPVGIECPDEFQEFEIDTGSSFWRVYARKVGDKWDIDSWIKLMNN